MYTLTFTAADDADMHDPLDAPDLFATAEGAFREACILVGEAEIVWLWSSYGWWQSHEIAGTVFRVTPVRARP